MHEGAYTHQRGVVGQVGAEAQAAGEVDVGQRGGHKRGGA